jgi:hypothetical protein
MVGLDDAFSIYASVFTRTENDFCPTLAHTIPIRQVCLKMRLSQIVLEGSSVLVSPAVQLRSARAITTHTRNVPLK